MGHKLGLIGFGGMAEWHLRNVRDRVSGIDVVAATDVRQERLTAAAEQGLKTYNTGSDLLADKDIDIVTIATPNNYHMDLAIAALKAGKTVISEKPVTMNANELENIIQAANTTGNIFTVHQNRRWDKDFLTIKKILEDGTIGDAKFIESRVEGSRGGMFGWRGFKVNGGGMLLDWGVHLIDQLLFMIDANVVSVGANLINIMSEDVDDNDKIQLIFENGIVAHIDLFTNCFVNMPRWRVLCDGGTAVIDDWDVKGKIVRGKPDSAMAWEDVIVYTAAGPTRTMAPRPIETTDVLPLPHVEADWTEYYKNILAVLDDGDELIVKPEQCLRVMKVIDMAFKSNEQGESIKCVI